MIPMDDLIYTLNYDGDILQTRICKSLSHYEVGFESELLGWR